MRSAGTDIAIRRARRGDLEPLAALFDDYRQFYDQAPARALCTEYIRDRLTRAESVIFVGVGRPHEDMVGFTQLYPSFCSVAAARIFVLYDLFVAKAARRRGVGRMLMKAAERFARKAGAVRIDLETHRTNLGAQRLYESLGYHRDEEFYRYALTL